MERVEVGGNILTESCQRCNGKDFSGNHSDRFYKLCQDVSIPAESYVRNRTVIVSYVHNFMELYNLLNIH